MQRILQMFSNYPNAVKFDKDNYNESISYENSGEFDTDHTVSMWMNMDNLSSNVWLFGMRDALNTNMRYSVHTKSGDSGFGLWNGSSFKTISYNWSHSTWLHLTVVLTSSNTTYYVNGEQIDVLANAYGFIIFPNQL